MKKNVLIFFLLCYVHAFSQTSITYPGNGKENFGGAIGKGSLNITETADSLSFTLKRGTGLFDSVIVFYLDAQAGGISSTSTLSGSDSDPYTAAVAGHNPSKGRSVLNFGAGFAPDGAIAFDKNGGKVFYFINVFGVTFIQEGSSFNVSPSGTNSAPAYSQRLSKSDLGLSGSLDFKFLGTYIGKSASRSNEAFGDPFNDYSRTMRTDGYNPYTTTAFFTFNAATALPVQLVDFKGAKQQNIINLNWSVASETNIEHYEVQRSANGVDFSAIATLKAKNAPGTTNYTIQDASPMYGTNYYRLLIKELGKTTISKVVSFNIEKKLGFKAYLSATNSLVLILGDLTAENYKLSIISNNGQIVQAQNLQVDGATQTKQIQLYKSLLKGVYRLSLQSSKHQFTTNILVQ